MDAGGVRQELFAKVYRIATAVSDARKAVGSRGATIVVRSFPWTTMRSTHALFDAGGVRQVFFAKVSKDATDIESWRKAVGAIHANMVARRRPCSYPEC